MARETTTISIPAALRDLLAERAKMAGLSQDAVADAALRRQLADAHAQKPDNGDLADRYLTDRRVSPVGPGAPTIHVARDMGAAAERLATAMGMELGRGIPKGRVIQALLW